MFKRDKGAKGWGAGAQTGALLHDDRALLVVSGLPDADDRAVRLHLVDVATGHPDVLRPKFATSFFENVHLTQ